MWTRGDVADGHQRQFGTSLLKAQCYSVGEGWDSWSLHFRIEANIRNPSVVLSCFSDLVPGKMVTLLSVSWVGHEGPTWQESKLTCPLATQQVEMRSGFSCRVSKLQGLPSFQVFLKSRIFTYSLMGDGNCSIGVNSSVTWFPICKLVIMMVQPSWVLVSLAKWQQSIVPCLSHNFLKNW